ncbi:MAG: hydrogenase maturation protease [Bacteroidetes bacterium]|nr:MAG: hydrogenase maturation protease [Bacteroidota bacterium]RLD89447.1 MAG: hydrogenase maturation protease [Bacteroidota bacterium]
MPVNKTLILGLGNILLQDEGIGVHTLQHLEKMEWPENVELLDGGTGGFVLLSLFHDYNIIVIIDAALSNAPPGTINVVRPKFAKDFPKSLSTHELGLKDMIESAILLGETPEIHLVTCTIHPKQAMNIHLSPEIEKKIPEIIRKVEQIIQL